MRRLAALVLLVLLGASARADDKRPLPDYDGRPDPPPTAGEALLWVPRIVVSPLYFVSEYLLRRPMRVLVITGEKNQWPVRIMDFLFDRPAGLIPTFWVDLGLRPTAGFYFFWNDAVFPGNQVRATASFSAGVASATLTDRVTRGPWRVALRAHASTRNDLPFHGLGPESREQDRTRYEMRQLELGVSLRWRLAPLSGASLEAGARLVDFSSGACCGDPPIAMGAFPPPPGLAEGGHAGPFARLRLALDSRSRVPATGIGAIVELDAGSDPDTDRAWLRAGATVAASVDVTGRRRVISLIFHGERAEGEAPFSELPTLGGAGPLPGFRAGRLAGGSALSATLMYEWPVWAYLGGVLHVGAGNVFASDLSDLDVDLLRGSAGIGIRSLDIGDHRMELLLAVGTGPLGRGGGLESVRFAIGGVTGF
jgi:hypothetical protein